MRLPLPWLSLLLLGTLGLTQSTGQTSSGPDSLYIDRFKRFNDTRVLYGSRGSSLLFGSRNQSGAASGSGFYNNVNDIIGFGLTYKYIDFDYAFSLPQTKLLKEGLQNLKQFKLSGSYYGRKLTIGGYWMDSQGLVISDASAQFQSSPDVHVKSIGAQFTINFNSKKYSYKAANFQNELQLKSSGAFLFRIEPFYRKIGVGAVLVPSALDNVATYGDQAGLRYVTSPGVSFLPGYGYNIALKGGKFFVSPLMMLGGGFAISAYQGSVAEHVIVNSEWTALAMLNMGYNGSRVYVAIRSYYEVHHFVLNPSYFTTTDVRIGITAGYRFMDLEKFIPRP